MYWTWFWRRSLLSILELAETCDISELLDVDYQELDLLDEIDFIDVGVLVIDGVGVFDCEIECYFGVCERECECYVQFPVQLTEC
ncbi:MAG: hypothetical protein EZS28_019301 [Streblomastix strix]|uniref:Uncharacterized protein n=1 Tax=Streblomastix strix TaxID=222440 RepID=A0A5J4VRK3_9EUKA|nr:MAG: hypothetical protein EZS28_019301 [Streblomastix strix]